MRNLIPRSFLEKVAVHREIIDAFEKLRSTGCTSRVPGGQPLRR